MRSVTALALAVAFAGCGSATKTSSAPKTFSAPAHTEARTHETTEGLRARPEARKASCSAMLARITSEAKKAREHAAGNPALEAKAVKAAEDQLAAYEQQCQRLR
jgi:hypothetical protein